MRRSTWVEYGRWNDALGEVLLGAERADSPVYLDVDDHALAQCAAILGIDTDEALASLASAVRATLQLEGGSPTLQSHARRYADWRRDLRGGVRSAKRTHDDIAFPPVIALLVVCVLGAARMGTDDGRSANAYYTRLNEVLGLDEAQGRRLRNDFHQTEAFWRGLNDFLERLEGRHGLPTAYALGHRYVGIPQSQALMRAHDRERLPQFFRAFGLEPRSSLIPADIERLLDAWIDATPSPVSASLRALWKSASARERIAGVAAVELAHWDGTLPPSSAASMPNGEVRLTSFIRQQFGGRSIELSFAVQFPEATDAHELRVSSADGEPLVGVIPAAGSRLRPKPGSQLDPESLVGAMLELTDPASATSARRRPRRVVPLRRDDLLGVDVEIDRLPLAEDVTLLVQDEPRLVASVLELIEANGRRGPLHRAQAVPGSEALRGMPEGWLLIEAVQLYAVPPNVQRIELQVLVPQTTAQLTFAGGLRIPGRIGKWSSLDPPELRAAVVGATSMSIRVWDITEDRLLLEHWTDEVSAMVHPLIDLDLADGEYEVELSVDGTAVSSRTLRLRSSDTPDVMTWETCASLNYEVGLDAAGALSASEVEHHGHALVDGLSADGTLEQDLIERPATHGPTWAGRRRSRSATRNAIVLGHADPKSCVVTGAHRMRLPTAHPGAKGIVEGVCEHCGLGKTYPARPRWRKEESPKSAPPRFGFVAAKPSTTTGSSWDACLDAVVHVGGGGIGTLERIASQAEGSSLFADYFLRTLEGLGHIDVRRDDRFQPVEWEANPAIIAETPSGSFVLAGVWSRAQRASLSSAARAAGGSLDQRVVLNSPTIWTVSDLDVDQLATITGEIGDAYLVQDAVDRMIEVLPTLSAIEERLPTTPIPTYDRCSMFDVDDAAWKAVSGVGIAGAYRLEQSFRSTTIWVGADGESNRTARIGGIQLVKHLAARATGKTLLGYLPDSEVLAVPLGADLPGIYGRTAMLCSGGPPVASPATRSLGYLQVPGRIADRLNALLAN